MIIVGKKQHLYNINTIIFILLIIITFFCKWLIYCFFNGSIQIYLTIHKNNVIIKKIKPIFFITLLFTGIVPFLIKKIYFSVTPPV